MLCPYSSSVEQPLSEGGTLRRQAASVSTALRSALERRDLPVLGRPCPIVSVVVGGNAEARVTSRTLARSGVLANLVEYPAVPINSTRFRFQVMPGHTADQCEQAASALASALVGSREAIRTGTVVQI